MELKLVRLRRIPRSKTGFIVDVLIDGKPFRTRAYVQSKFGHSIKLSEDEGAAMLLRTGRKVRYLVSAIIATYRGEKMRLPVRLEDSMALSQPSYLTVKGQKVLSPVGVG